MTRGSVAARAATEPQAMPDAGLVRAGRETDPESLESVIDLRSACVRSPHAAAPAGDTALDQLIHILL